MNELAEKKRKVYKEHGRVLIDKVGSDHYARLNYKPSVGGCIDNVVVHRTVPYFESWRDGVTYFSSDGVFSFRATLHNKEKTDYYSVYLDQIYGGMSIPNQVMESNGDWAPGYNWGLESNVLRDEKGTKMEFESLDEMTKWVHDRDSNNDDVKNKVFRETMKIKGHYAPVESTDRTHYHYGYVCRAHACDTYNIKVAYEPNINFSFDPTIIFPYDRDDNGHTKFFCGNLFDTDPKCGDECYRTGIWESGDDRWVNGKMLLPYTLVPNWKTGVLKPGFEIRIKKNSLCNANQTLTLEKWANRMGFDDKVDWNKDIIIRFHMGFLYLNKPDYKSFTETKKVPINALRKKNGVITAMYLDQGKGTSPYLDVDEGKVLCTKPLPAFFATEWFNTIENWSAQSFYGPSIMTTSIPPYIFNFIHNYNKCLVTAETKRLTYSKKEFEGYRDEVKTYYNSRTYNIPRKRSDQKLPQPWYVCNDQYYSRIYNPSSAITASAVSLSSIPECLSTNKDELNKYIKLPNNTYYELVQNYRSHLRFAEYKISGRKSIKFGGENYKSPHYKTTYSPINNSAIPMMTYPDVIVNKFRHQNLKITPKHRGFRSMYQIKIRHSDRCRI